MKDPTRIITPPTPFERRMEQLRRFFPPPPTHPLHKIWSTQAKVLSERDIALRLWLQEANQKLPSFLLARMKGGTQLPMANILRHYFQEYASRIMTHGFHSFPSSFNVVESFLAFSHDYLIFDLHEEREHLLRLRDFIEWFTSDVALDEPGILSNIIQEGVIYSYNMVAPREDFGLRTSESELVLVGVTLVRHKQELSMIALCGESPEFPGTDGFPDMDEYQPMLGKETLETDPELSADDRYVKELPGYSKVIALVRFDLRARRYYVRYLNRDIGASYLTATDDPTIFPPEIGHTKRKKVLAASAEILERYDPLFSSLATLLYLPAYFIAEQDCVTETNFSTELHSRRRATDVRRAVRRLPSESLYFSRTVLCMESTLASEVHDERRIFPPDFEVVSKGLWKNLPPGEVGRDEEGNPIVGRTWVERTETWSQHNVNSFVMRKRARRVRGPKPGFLYLIRSGAHSIDVYKIGKTTRSPVVRAKELSGATGVPTDFQVLFTWEVGNVDLIEREAHLELRQYRISSRREFFRCSPQAIIATINSIIARLDSNDEDRV